MSTTPSGFGMRARARRGPCCSPSSTARSWSSSASRPRCRRSSSARTSRPCALNTIVETDAGVVRAFADEHLRPVRLRGRRAARRSRGDASRARSRRSARRPRDRPRGGPPPGRTRPRERRAGRRGPRAGQRRRHAGHRRSPGRRVVRGSRSGRGRGRRPRSPSTRSCARPSR